MTDLNLKKLRQTLEQWDPTPCPIACEQCRCEQIINNQLPALLDLVDESEAKIRDAYEAWAGSELPSEPEAKTAPEAYAYQVIKWMLEPLTDALAKIRTARGG